MADGVRKWGKDREGKIYCISPEQGYSLHPSLSVSN